MRLDLVKVATLCVSAALYQDVKRKTARPVRQNANYYWCCWLMCMVMVVVVVLVAVVVVVVGVVLVLVVVVVGVAAHQWMSW